MAEAEKKTKPDLSDDVVAGIRKIIDDYLTTKGIKFSLNPEELLSWISKGGTKITLSGPPKLKKEGIYHEVEFIAEPPESDLPNAEAGANPKQALLEMLHKYFGTEINESTLEHIGDFIKGRKTVEAEGKIKASFNKMLDSFELELSNPVAEPTSCARRIFMKCNSTWGIYVIGCNGGGAPGFNPRNPIPERLKNLFQRSLNHLQGLAEKSPKIDEVVAIHRQLVQMNQEMLDFPKNGSSANCIVLHSLTR